MIFDKAVDKAIKRGEDSRVLGDQLGLTIEANMV